MDVLDHNSIVGAAAIVFVLWAIVFLGNSPSD
jgi:hypothetical protein